MTNALTATPLWGDLFHDPVTARAFSASAILSRCLDFEIAWTRALSACGIVPADMAAQAEAAIRAFDPDMDALGAGSARDGLPIPALVKALRAAAPDAAQAIHTGATSQDVLDTAMVLVLRDLLADFRARLSALVAALDGLDARSAGASIMGRTRMQDALPIPVSHRLAAWRTPLAALEGDAAVLAERIGQVQVGGAVGLRDEPPGQGQAVAAHVAQALGLHLGPVWHSDRQQMVGFGAWLSAVAGALGKIGADVGLMAQDGPGTIRFNGLGGSSAMPHKQNPVRAEILVALARWVAGQQGILGQALLHEQERSGAAWALEWLTLPAMAEGAGAALNNALALVGQIDGIGGTTGSP